MREEKSSERYDEDYVCGKEASWHHGEKCTTAREISLCERTEEESLGPIMLAENSEDVDTPAVVRLVLVALAFLTSRP